MTTNNVYGPLSIKVTSDGQGITRQSGTDEYDCRWIEIEFDAFAEQTESFAPNVKLLQIQGGYV